MRRLYVLVLVTAIMIVCNVTAQSVGASSGVVISQVQTRSLREDRASEELIELYNNSDIDIDITNWSLNYGSSGSIAVTRQLANFVPVLSVFGARTFIPARKSVLLVSKAFAEQYSDFGYDFIFSDVLVDIDRWISIVDDDKKSVDTVEWGTSVASFIAEGGQAAVSPTSSQLIQRKLLIPGSLQDTDNNLNDFELALPRTLYSYGSIYDVQDLCSNLGGIQEDLPEGYVSDESGTCSVPVVDVCLNLPNVQSEIPEGYKFIDNGDCIFDLLSLKITELLPNKAGTDNGNEFIEIYNPNSIDVDLANYVLYIGAAGTAFYHFPAGSHIGPGQYMVFSNVDIKFTLSNTTSSVRLKSADNYPIDETSIYVDAKDDMAWALIDNTWQYTNRPTPGSKNLLSLVIVKDKPVATSSLQPCAANQYRDPKTNRCRLIVTSSSTLTPCKEGQYRSKETNRCRSIASDISSLMPCAEGQERNPATNRCRSISVSLGNSELVPCKEGQERNPETNRCRNIVAMSQAEYAPDQTIESSNNDVFWWTLAGVGFVAISYGVWEWRTEMLRFFKKLASFLHFNK